jgi:hypothetical protein
MTKAAKHFENFILLVSPRPEPLNLAQREILCEFLASELKKLAWNVDILDYPPEVRPALKELTGAIKRDVLECENTLRKAKRSLTIHAVQGSQYKLLVRQGQELCELILPGRVERYGRIFTGI